MPKKGAEKGGRGARGQSNEIDNKVTRGRSAGSESKMAGRGGSGRGGSAKSGGRSSSRNKK